jgi:hypothetical protein
LGDNTKCVKVRHHHIASLILSARYQDAKNALDTMSAIAARINDETSTAYMLASTISVSSFVSPPSVQDFEDLSRRAIIAAAAASNVGDVYIQNIVKYVVANDEFQRGRIAKSQNAIEQLLADGLRLNDPRATGLGMALLAFQAMSFADYVGALDFAENSIAIALVPHDLALAKFVKVVSLLVLKRPGAVQCARDWMDECAANDWQLYLSVADIAWALVLAVNGEIGASLRWAEKARSRVERDGFQWLADSSRMGLCDAYLEIISGKEKPPIKVLARNGLTLITVMFTAEKRISSLVEKVRQNPQFDPNGIHIGRCEMILGLLYKAKKKRALAVQNLTEAKRIISQFGPTPMLAKIETALAEVS